MKPFSIFSEAKIDPVALGVKWVKSAYTRIWIGDSSYSPSSNQVGQYIPLSNTLVKKLLDGEEIDFSGFHITSSEGLVTLLDIEGSKKSISAMTLFTGFAKSNRKLSPELLRNLGSIGVITSGVWHNGIACKISGKVLIHRNMDIMSIPDDNGRRWIATNVFFSPSMSYDVQNYTSLREKLMEQAESTARTIESRFSTSTIAPLRSEFTKLIQTFSNEPTIKPLWDKYTAISVSRLLAMLSPKVSIRSLTRLGLFLGNAPKACEPDADSGIFLKLMDAFMNFKDSGLRNAFIASNDSPNEINLALETCKKYEILLETKRKAWKKKIIESYYQISQDALIESIRALPAETLTPLDSLIDAVSSQNRILNSYDEAVVNQIEISEIFLHQSEYDQLPNRVLTRLKSKKLTIMPDSLNTYGAKVKSLIKTPEKFQLPPTENPRDLARKTLAFVNNPIPFRVTQ